ncbi:hypothetical protein PC9H_004558 [Pleurotus ostreatus]|uniref:Glucose-methanol-choline oxidoreductase N-terminal domain-containing protein n=1 Tax=Pleurotus ostreatus TaxID=5322 RepID=A0A8H6ZXX3_PLEOS|nr:uncharacterized protein PC9H_004558 [Pleurotus ostreatus]KAF7432616.1 hypothetical protein PC9H_004558 [Pleurotus ostreatus]
MTRIVSFSVLSVVFLDAVIGGFVDSAADIASAYDFIVVGGGTAGNVVANRLSEDPLIQVLVIEAGGSNERLNGIEMPFLLAPAFDTTYSWNFTTVPQPGLGGRSLPFARGFVLGGSSSINGMIYSRGSAEDYDATAQLTGDEGWAWDNLQPYIRKASLNERWAEPVDNHPTSGQFNPTVHGLAGITSVSLPPLAKALDRQVTQTTEESPEFQFNLDTNSGNQLGIGWLQSTITSEGRRDSSATSYLGPSFISRPNLHILLNSQVTRLLPASDESDDDTSIFDLTDTPGTAGPKHVVTAKKEIILSAGSIGTPHILLHSGIGDRDELSNLGISPTHHLPGVGKNLTEQPAVNNVWLVDSTSNDPDVSGLPAGFFTHIGFLRIPDNASIFETVEDPAPGPNTARIEFNSVVVDPISSVGSLSITTNVLTPISRGSVTLNSSDPLDDPLIDLGLLEHEFESFTMREAVRAAQRFLDSPAWDDYIIGPSEALASVDFKNDSQLNAYVRKNAAPALHPVSTAAMSPYNVSWGVTDPDLKVKGVQGVRVVDASVLPLIPSGHTQAPVYIIAERASDLIKLAWNITV